MVDSEIETLLQKAIGLKVTSIGKVSLDRSVQRRMKALAIDNRNIYIEKLKSSTLELKDLIEEVIIPETWFFRDHEPFKAMIQYLLSFWAPKHPHSTFKVLSVPCATGEEPYSLAMSLLDSRWPAEKFIVHAVDISQRSITRAKEGLYSEHSFRGGDLIYRSQHFQKSGNNFYAINKNVRSKVHFHTGNILNRIFMESLGLFDVIFFRNVLIYFDGESRQKALAILSNNLNDDGILFVGHAETNLLSTFPFIPAPYPQAFAFHKKPQQIFKTAAEKPVIAVPWPQKRTIPLTAPSPDKVQKNETGPPDLGFARKLADKGELIRATAICQEYLSRCGPSAQAFFLLGIIRDAADDTTQAEKFFRKALYLEPKHEESLIFLALLSEKKGAVSEANALKKRIERLQGKNVSGHQNSKILSD